MSSGDNPSQRQTSSNESQESRRPVVQTTIEFIDSRQSGTRSAIQRHTAHHSAAQRREQRLQQLRSQQRIGPLPWARREDTTATPVTQSSSSDSTATTPTAASTRRRKSTSKGSTGKKSGERNSEQDSSSSTPQESSSSSANARTLSPQKEDAIRFLIDNVCPMSTYGSLYPAIVESIRGDDASIQLLLAYAFSLRASSSTARQNEADVQRAQRALARGTNILWNRLHESEGASSDVNVQAVMLLMAHTADFGEAEQVQLHADALRTMIDQRGGLESFVGNEILYRQLATIQEWRTFHLTLGCGALCTVPLRFPEGFWNANTQSSDPS